MPKVSINVEQIRKYHPSVKTILLSGGSNKMDLSNTKLEAEMFLNVRKF